MTREPSHSRRREAAAAEQEPSSQIQSCTLATARPQRKQHAQQGPEQRAQRHRVVNGARALAVGAKLGAQTQEPRSHAKPHDFALRARVSSRRRRRTQIFLWRRDGAAGAPNSRVLHMNQSLNKVHQVGLKVKQKSHVM
jgi:hypothetical protein